MEVIFIKLKQNLLWGITEAIACVKPKGGLDLI